jgi:hypothetical protein
VGAFFFKKISNLNKSMQCFQINTLTQNSECNAFMKKLKLWKRNIKRNIFDIFPAFERCRPSSETEAMKESCINHLGDLQKQFSSHFKDIDISKFEWTRNSSENSDSSVGIALCYMLDKG